MNAAKRQDLRALIDNPPEPPEAPPAAAPPPAEVAEPGQAATSAPARARQRPRKGRRPAAELVAPAREAVPREALKADVPAELDLLRRLHLYRLDHGTDIRDQVALAVDEWLRARDY